MLNTKVGGEKQPLTSAEKKRQSGESPEVQWAELVQQQSADTTHSSRTEAEPPGSASKERNKQQENEISHGERTPGVCPPQQTPPGAAGEAWAAGLSLPAGISACSTQGMDLPCWTGQYLVVQHDRDCT